MLNSCSEETTIADQTAKYPYVIFSYNVTDQSGFMSSFSSIPSGSLDVSGQSTAKQLKNAWTCQSYGKYLFTGYNSIGEVGIQKYSVDDNGKFIDEGFLPTTGDHRFQIVDDSRGYYCDVKRDKLTLQTFNPTTMLRTGQIDLSSLTKGFPWETVGLRNMFVRDGKLFADLNYSNSTAGYGDDAIDSCMFVVIDIATNTYVKTIIKPNVRGTGYVNDIQYWAMDDTKTVYVLSYGNLFGERNSHVSRILPGTDDFDPSYVVNVDSIIFDGMFMNLYCWKNRLFVLASTEVIKPDFSNFQTDIYNWYELDKGSKTLTLIPGLPASNFQGQQNPVGIGDKLYFPCNNTSSAAYFVYDGVNPATSAFSLAAGKACGIYKLD